MLRYFTVMASLVLLLTCNCSPIHVNVCAGETSISTSSTSPLAFSHRLHEMINELTDVEEQLSELAREPSYTRHVRNRLHRRHLHHQDQDQDRIRTRASHSHSPSDSDSLVSDHDSEFVAEVHSVLKGGPPQDKQPRPYSRLDDPADLSLPPQKPNIFQGFVQMLRPSKKDVSQPLINKPTSGEEEKYKN